MQIALFVTCVNDAVFPETGKSVTRILERLGHEVVFPPEQTCCGQMHLNSGYRTEALRLARKFVAGFAAYDVIVAPSASCVGTIVDSYAHLAEHAGDDELLAEVRALAPRVHELCELLVDVLGVTDVGAAFPHKVTYHPTCHSLRVLQLGDRPQRLLDAVHGIELVPLPDATSCCGFGGTFAIKNAETSVAMVADKLGAVQQSGAEVLCAADNSCLAHIGGAASRLRSGIRVMHIAEILAAEGAR